jgi:hypothetical protein
MRYLTLYSGTSTIVCIDLHKPARIDIIDGIYYADKFDLEGFQSNYKNIYKAKFNRTAESSDPATSRQIVWWEIPKRLSTEEVISVLQALLQRGHDKKKRKMNPNSLANLRPTKPFTPGHRPSKPRKLTDEQLNEAIELRANGCSWRKVGDILECNYQTVRSSLRRSGEQKPNSGEITKLLTGDEMPSSYDPTLEGCSTR